MVKHILEDKFFVRSEFFEDKINGKLYFRIVAKCEDKLQQAATAFNLYDAKPTGGDLGKLLELLGKSLQDG